MSGEIDEDLCGDQQQYEGIPNREGNKGCSIES
jgi:hypothetical protein